VGRGRRRANLHGVFSKENSKKKGGKAGNVQAGVRLAGWGCAPDHIFKTPRTGEKGVGEGPVARKESRSAEKEAMNCLHRRGLTSPESRGGEGRITKRGGFFRQRGSRNIETWERTCSFRKKKTERYGAGEKGRAGVCSNIEGSGLQIAKEAVISSRGHSEKKTGLGVTRKRSPQSHSGERAISVRLSYSYRRRGKDSEKGLTKGSRWERKGRLL